MLSEAAKKARAEYQKELRDRDREKYNEYQKAWAKANPDKVRATKARYWERKAQEMQELA